MLKYKRTEQDYLTFRGNRVSTGRNKIHPYPAMLHPMLVDFLIDKHGISGNIIFDPFCGSGTTLLRASMRGFKSYGLDVNPLAILISKAKTQIYSSDLILEFEHLKRDILENESPLFFDNTKIDIPDIRNMSYWFSSEATRSLGIIRSALAKDYKYKDFFVTNFAFVCRDQSYTRKGEFKRYRITEDKIRKTKDESVYRFVNKTDSMIHEFLKTNPAISSHPILGNSEIDVPNIEYDLVITSPPYGDSKTTVAYGQYSSFGSEWIRGLNKYETMTYDVDKECLGKSGYINKGIYNCKPLMDILTVIKDKDRKRYLDVLYFFNGYLKSIIRTAINLKEGGKMCFVVGNRTVKGFQIPMDQITAYFMDEIGLTFKEILVRNILNKVMPYKNSPTNQSGVKSKTMTKEYIVIFRK